MENYNCDGSGPHSRGEVRVYPLGSGGNLILCVSCWVRENKYRFERGKETNADLWPQENWDTAKKYGED